MLSTNELRRRFQRALDIAGGTHNTHDVMAAVQSGKMQSWQEGQSVVVTEVLGAPQTNICNVFLVAGNMEEIMSIQPRVVKFAKEMGCSKITMRGRPGWAKVLPEYGWHAPGVMYELPITNLEE